MLKKITLMQGMLAVIGSSYLCKIAIENDVILIANYYKNSALK